MTPTYHKGQRNYGTGYDMMARIDELEAACWRMQEERDRAIGWRDSDKDRADRAEARLEKAVEGMNVAKGFYQVTHIHAALDAALAELTGGKDD